MLLLILIFSLFIFSLYNLRKKEKTLTEKNKQLVESYLNLSFINKILIHSLKTSCSSSFCSFLIKEIKEHYNLQELLVIDSIKYFPENNSDSIKDSVIKFIKKDTDNLLKKFPDHGIQQFSIDVNNTNHTLYISKLLLAQQSDGLIVCVETEPSLLSKIDRTGLENAINLLKNRLFYE
jgi:hypothetical protein